MGLDARLSETLSYLADKLCHLNCSLLVGSLLVEELEHLGDEGLAHHELESDLLVLFLQKLLLEHQVLQVGIPLLSSFFLLTHADE